MPVELTDNIAPSGDSGGTPATFSTHLDIYGNGGYRSVADQSERLGNSGLLTELRRKLGMAVYQQDTNKLYILTNNPATATTTTGDWTEFTGGGNLAIEDEGVQLTAAAASIDFVGAGVIATTSGDDVTVTIPGGAGPAYNWIIGDGSASPSNSKTINATEQVDFVSGNSGIQVILSGASSPYEVELRNRGQFSITDAQGTPNQVNINTGNTTDSIKFTGYNGIDTLLDTAANNMKISISGYQPVDLTHNKIWAGDSSDEAYEADVIEVSNTADDNYVGIRGNADTQLRLGSGSVNKLNVVTQIYTEEDDKLILGHTNTSATSINGTTKAIIIGGQALELGPGAGTHNGFVAIGNKAQYDSTGGGCRFSVIIGNDAGHQTNVGLQNYANVIIGHEAGQRAGWRGIYLGIQAGSNPLHSLTSFPNICIGHATYSTGGDGIVIGGASHVNGAGSIVGHDCEPIDASAINNVILGYQSKVGGSSVTVGAYAYSNNRSESIGYLAGRYWDENEKTDRYNTFIGFQTGRGDGSGDSKGQYNVAIGAAAMSNAGYDGNTASPSLSLQPANNNIAIGYNAGRDLRSGGNVAIGVQALQEYNASQTSNIGGNVAIGDNAANSLVGNGTDSCAFNVFIGSHAASSITEGQHNTLVGNIASNFTGTLDKATALGSGTKSAEGGLALGYDADQTNKGQAPNPTNQSFRNLISIGSVIASAFIDSSKGDSQTGSGNYCFFNNNEALAGGLKHGDIYVLSDGEESNTPEDPYRLCIVLEAGS